MMTENRVIRRIKIMLMDTPTLRTRRNAKLIGWYYAREFVRVSIGNLEKRNNKPNPQLITADEVNTMRRMIDFERRMRLELKEFDHALKRRCGDCESPKKESV